MIRFSSLTVEPKGIRNFSSHHECLRLEFFQLGNSHQVGFDFFSNMKFVFDFEKRNRLSKDLLYGKDGNLSDGLTVHTYTSFAGTSTTEQKLGSKGGVSVSYTVFKGKAALSVTPVLPTFTKLQSGLNVVDRRGVMMLKFIPAIGERKYDYEKKQMFALSPTEVGSLISMGSNDSCEFFHDPSMLSSNAGQVRKSLLVKPHVSGSGYMISLTVVNNILKTRENISVPFTAAEFAVVKTACSYALPHILGWDWLTKGMDGPRDAEGHAASSMVNRRLLDSEWEK